MLKIDWNDVKVFDLFIRIFGAIGTILSIFPIVDTIVDIYYGRVDLVTYITVMLIVLMLMGSHVLLCWRSNKNSEFINVLSSIFLYSLLFLLIGIFFVSSISILKSGFDVFSCPEKFIDWERCNINTRSVFLISAVLFAISYAAVFYFSKNCTSKIRKYSIFPIIVMFVWVFFYLIIQGNLKYFANPQESGYAIESTLSISLMLFMLSIYVGSIVREEIYEFKKDEYIKKVKENSVSE